LTFGALLLGLAPETLSWSGGGVLSIPATPLISTSPSPCPGAAQRIGIHGVFIKPATTSGTKCEPRFSDLRDHHQPAATYFASRHSRCPSTATGSVSNGAVRRASSWAHHPAAAHRRACPWANARPFENRLGRPLRRTAEGGRWVGPAAPPPTAHQARLRSGGAISRAGESLQATLARRWPQQVVRSTTSKPLRPAPFSRKACPPVSSCGTTPAVWLRRRPSSGASNTLGVSFPRRPRVFPPAPQHFWRSGTAKPLYAVTSPSRPESGPLSAGGSFWRDAWERKATPRHPGLDRCGRPVVHAPPG